MLNRVFHLFHKFLYQINFTSNSLHPNSKLKQKRLLIIERHKNHYIHISTTFQYLSNKNGSIENFPINKFTKYYKNPRKKNTGSLHGKENSAPTPYLRQDINQYPGIELHVSRDRCSPYRHLLLRIHYECPRVNMLYMKAQKRTCGKLHT